MDLSASVEFCMLELDKILELDHQLSSIRGLRDNVDRNHAAT
jgi:hypothetical protein